MMINSIVEQRPQKPAPSLALTVLNVFASPSEVAPLIHDSIPSRTLWLIPMLCFILLFIVNTFLIFTNTTLKSEFNDTQIRILQTKVKEGKITQEQADQIESNIDTRNKSLIVLSIAGGIFTIVLLYFGCALILWLANKFILESTTVYIKHLELFGITTWIMLLGKICSMAMMISFGTVLATPSVAFIVLGSDDTTSVFYRILTTLNIFSIWEIVVVGIGLSKLSGKHSGEGIMIVFALWTSWIAVSALFRFII